MSRVVAEVLYQGEAAEQLPPWLAGRALSIGMVYRLHADETVDEVAQASRAPADNPPERDVPYQVKRS